ncbi:hypothetical protein RBY4I_3322 [Rhodobacterales bacterium Y4I]|nr:hypothetical protein RBY4I_3322 [Rhodobacterales bacterium Y4I]
MVYKRSFAAAWAIDQGDTSGFSAIGEEDRICDKGTIMAAF